MPPLTSIGAGIAAGAISLTGALTGGAATSIGAGAGAGTGAGAGEVAATHPPTELETPFADGDGRNDECRSSGGAPVVEMPLASARA